MKLSIKPLKRFSHIWNGYSNPRLKSWDNYNRKACLTVSTVFQLAKVPIMLIILFLLSASITFAQSEDEINEDDCTFNDFALYGKIQFVESFPDITIKVVESFPDLKVKIVDSFPDDCGEWQIVDSFPDLKIKIVESFPNIKIKFVESFPGLP
jgi:hypothetical protein